MSSSFHLSPLKPKKPLGVRLTDDDYRIQNKEKTTTKLNQLAHYFFVSVRGRTETPSGQRKISTGPETIIENMVF